jgi:hypothetical protein
MTTSAVQTRPRPLARVATLVLFTAVALGRPGAARSAPHPQEGEGEEQGPEQAQRRRRLSVGATLYGYAVPDEPDFLMLVVPVDIGRLHVEGRYDYESLHSGSIFAGVSVRAGERVQLKATAMVGGVFGDLDGVAPALRLTLSFGRLDLFVEAEYVFDLHDLGASFFYSWSEAGFSPLAWLRLGLVVQRTRVLHNDLDLQRGVFVGVTVLGAVTLAAYELNLGWISPTYVGAVGVSF